MPTQNSGEARTASTSGMDSPSIQEPRFQASQAPARTPKIYAITNPVTVRMMVLGSTDMMMSKTGLRWWNDTPSCPCSKLPR